MSETDFEKTVWIGRMARLPLARGLVLVVVSSVLATLAVTASTSAATLFTNPTPITIPDNGNASPYPSEIPVSGLNGPITDVTVTLDRFGHADPDDVDILLVSPGGKSVILMSDACGITEVEDFSWTFSQSAPARSPRSPGLRRIRLPSGQLRRGRLLAFTGAVRPLLHQPRRVRPDQPQRRVATLGQRRLLRQHGVFHQPLRPGDLHGQDATHGGKRGPRQRRQGVRRVANVSATFSEAMRPGSINRNTFELFKAGTTTRIGATVNYDQMGGRALLNPNSNLRPKTRYKAVVTTGAKDLSGNGLDQNPNVTGNQQKVWFFTTRN